MVITRQMCEDAIDKFVIETESIEEGALSKILRTAGIVGALTIGGSNIDKAPSALAGVLRSSMGLPAPAKTVQKQSKGPIFDKTDTTFWSNTIGAPVISSRNTHLNAADVVRSLPGTPEEQTRYKQIASAMPEQLPIEKVDMANRDLLGKRLKGAMGVTATVKDLKRGGFIGVDTEHIVDGSSARDVIAHEGVHSFVTPIFHDKFRDKKDTTKSLLAIKQKELADTYDKNLGGGFFPRENRPYNFMLLGSKNRGFKDKKYYGYQYAGHNPHEFTAEAGSSSKINKFLRVVPYGKQEGSKLNPDLTIKSVLKGNVFVATPPGKNLRDEFNNMFDTMVNVAIRDKNRSKNTVKVEELKTLVSNFILS